MKKLVSLFMLLCSVVVLNAQTQIGFIYNGQTYQNGETMVVTLSPSAINCHDIAFKNQTPSRLADLVVTMTEVEQGGVEAWGLCTGEHCIPALTSDPFILTPNATYSDFSIDLNVDATVAQPYGVYNLEISNGSITCAVVVRFQAYTEGISDVAATSLKAYPNPAQGQVTISYDVDQPATLAIYDMQGRMVREQSVCGNGTMQLNDLTAGVYTYGIAGGKMQKLIVK